MPFWVCKVTWADDDIMPEFLGPFESLELAAHYYGAWERSAERKNVPSGVETVEYFEQPE